MEKVKRKVMLDVDTGSDDAIAIMCALLSDEIDVVGISAVNGNRGIDFTTENTLRVVEHLNSKVPVYRGCHLPLASTLTRGRRNNIPYRGPAYDDEDVHGDYIPLPKATIKEQGQHAVLWILETLTTTKEKITVIMVGPLTNLALALRINPNIIDNIEEIIIMGGGHLIKNVTPAAEFNFWVDPEAAKIVMDCGAPIRLIPLDATHAAYITKDDCEKISSYGNKAAKLCAELILSRIKGYKTFQPMPVENSVPIHDALAVIALLEPEVLAELTELYVEVSVTMGPCDGMTYLDIEHRTLCEDDPENLRKKPKPVPPNAKTALSANRDIFINKMFELFA